MHHNHEEAQKRDKMAQNEPKEKQNAHKMQK